MKNKKWLIIIGIVILVLVIIAVAYFLTKKNTNNMNMQEFFGLEIKGELVYSEYTGSSSVERRSVVYKDQEDNWIITTRYFNCGEAKVENCELTASQKEELLAKINANRQEENGSQYPDNNKEGGSSNYATEYISSAKGKGITPVDLEALGYVKNIYDVL